MSAEFQWPNSESRSAKRSGTREEPIAETSKLFSALFISSFATDGISLCAQLVKLVVSIPVIVANAVSKNESEPWTFSK